MILLPAFVLLAVWFVRGTVRRMSAALALAVASAIVLALHAWRWLTFGSLVPNSALVQGKTQLNGPALIVAMCCVASLLLIAWLVSQRQRLGIARALYSGPRLLVLDEATSALDAETEAAITDTIKELEGRVTTIAVAHRLATVRSVDQLLYMRDGRIVARRTFEEVRAQEPDFERQAALLGL